MQLITKSLKGKVKKAINREYGHTLINIKKNHIFKGINKNRFKVWMAWR